VWHGQPPVVGVVTSRDLPKRHEHSDVWLDDTFAGCGRLDAHVAAALDSVRDWWRVAGDTKRIGERLTHRYTPLSV
jgi:hypothetical protein